MRAAFAKVAPPAFLGLVPLALLAILLTKEWHQAQLAPDFHELYIQAHLLLTSGVPFDPPNVAIQGQNRVYTVTTVLFATPLTLLSASAAEVAMTALLIASTVATAYILNVRDWRVYGAIFLWPPVLSGIQTGNLTLLLGLLAALGWRYRSRQVLAGALVGLAFAMKVFMWPLAFWLIATRRYRATVAAALTGAASLVVILPFGSPIAYFRLAHRNAEVMGVRAYSLYVLLGDDTAARLVWLAVALAAIIAAFLYSNDQSSFTLAVAACVLFSPIVWLHYFGLLLVPLALARPRFGIVWLVPLVDWALPFAPAARWQIVLALSAMSCVVLASLSRRPPRRVPLVRRLGPARLTSVAGDSERP